MNQFTQVSVTDETDGKVKISGATANGGGQEGALITVRSEHSVQLTPGRCYLLQGNPDLDDSAIFHGPVVIGGGGEKHYTFHIDNNSCRGIGDPVRSDPDRG